MRRVSILITLVALVGAVTAVGRHAPSLAQEATPAAEPDIVGSWIVTVTVTNEDPDYSFVNFSTYMPGGVLVTTAPDSPLGHGAWARRDDGRYAATMVFPDFDDDAGALEGQVTVWATLTLDPDGTTFTGPFLTEIADATGAVLYSFEGTAEGQRIQVTPLETALAGTPVRATPTA